MMLLRNGSKTQFRTVLKNIKISTNLTVCTRMLTQHYLNPYKSYIIYQNENHEVFPLKVKYSMVLSVPLDKKYMLETGKSFV
jgi:hypothetical protein